jgi:hypothetical protein
MRRAGLPVFAVRSVTASGSLLLSHLLSTTSFINVLPLAVSGGR